MSVIHVLTAVICLFISSVVFAASAQTHATPADGLVHEGQMLWSRDKKGAIEKVKQALAIAPTRSDIHIELASMYLLIGERAKALAVVDAHGNLYAQRFHLAGSTSDG